MEAPHRPQGVVGKMAVRLRLLVVFSVNMLQLCWEVLLHTGPVPVLFVLKARSLFLIDE
jgi:hypothetical protein